jgi:hypothetical protein
MTKAKKRPRAKKIKPMPLPEVLLAPPVGVKPLSAKDQAMWLEVLIPFEAMIADFFSNPEVEELLHPVPDGSLVLDAFKAGYYFALGAR